MGMEATLYKKLVSPPYHNLGLIFGLRNLYSRNCLRLAQVCVRDLGENYREYPRITQNDYLFSWQLVWGKRVLTRYQKSQI